MNLIEYVINNTKEKVLYQIELKSAIEELMECQNEINNEIFSNLNESYKKVGYREIKNEMLNEIEDKIYQFILNEEVGKKDINPYEKNLIDNPILTDNIRNLKLIILKLKKFKQSLNNIKHNMTQEEYNDFVEEYQTVITAMNTLKTLYYGVIDNINSENNFNLYLKMWLTKWFNLFENSKGAKKIVKSMVEIIEECNDEKINVNVLVKAFNDLTTKIKSGNKTKIEIEIPKSQKVQQTINHVMNRLLIDTDSSYSKSSRTVGYGECLLYFILVLSENKDEKDDVSKVTAKKVSNPEKLDISIDNVIYDVKYFNVSIPEVLVFIGEGMKITPINPPKSITQDIIIDGETENEKIDEITAVESIGEGVSYDISVGFSLKKVKKSESSEIEQVTITTKKCKYREKNVVPENPRYVFMSHNSAKSKKTGNFDDDNMNEKYRQYLTDMILNGLYLKGLKLILVTANSTSNIHIQVFNNFSDIKGKLYCPFNSDGHFKVLLK